MAALVFCVFSVLKFVKLSKSCWVNCLSRVTSIIFRLKTSTVACSIRGLRYGFLVRIRLSAKMCWNCKVMAVR